MKVGSSTLGRMKRCALLALVVAASLGCSSRPECVIDTDCRAIDTYCSTDQHCVPIGSGGDSGGGDRDTGGRDTGPAVDAGDTGARDTGPVGDTGARDGSSDTGPMDTGCPAAAGHYVVARVSPMCATVMIGSVDVVANAGCMFAVSSPDDSTFGGPVSRSADGALHGSLTIGMMSFAECSVMVAGNALTIDCAGMCVVDGTRMP